MTQPENLHSIVTVLSVPFPTSTQQSTAGWPHAANTKRTPATKTSTPTMLPTSLSGRLGLSSTLTPLMFRAGSSDSKAG